MLLEHFWKHSRPPQLSSICLSDMSLFRRKDGRKLQDLDLCLFGLYEGFVVLQGPHMFNRIIWSWKTSGPHEWIMISWDSSGRYWTLTNFDTTEESFKPPSFLVALFDESRRRETQTMWKCFPLRQLLSQNLKHFFGGSLSHRIHVNGIFIDMHGCLVWLSCI